MYVVTSALSLYLVCSTLASADRQFIHPLARRGKQLTAPSSRETAHAAKGELLDVWSREMDHPGGGGQVADTAFPLWLVIGFTHFRTPRDVCGIEKHPDT